MPDHCRDFINIKFSSSFQAPEPYPELEPLTSTPKDLTPCSSWLTQQGFEPNEPIVYPPEEPIGYKEEHELNTCKPVFERPHSNLQIEKSFDNQLIQESLDRNTGSYNEQPNQLNQIEPAILYPEFRDISPKKSGRPKIQLVETSDEDDEFEQKQAKPVVNQFEPVNPSSRATKFEPVNQDKKKTLNLESELDTITLNLESELDTINDFLDDSVESGIGGQNSHPILVDADVTVESNLHFERDSDLGQEDDPGLEMKFHTNSQGGMRRDTPKEGELEQVRKHNYILLVYSNVIILYVIFSPITEGVEVLKRFLFSMNNHKQCLICM